MIALFWLLLALSVSPFKSKNGLAAEIGQRDHRADTGDRHQAPAHIIVADDGQQAAIPARADPPRAQVKVVE